MSPHQDSSEKRLELDSDLGKLGLSDNLLPMCLQLKLQVNPFKVIADFLNEIVSEQLLPVPIPLSQTEPRHHAKSFTLSLTVGRATVRPLSANTMIQLLAIQFLHHSLCSRGKICRNLCMSIAKSLPRRCQLHAGRKPGQDRVQRSPAQQYLDGVSRHLRVTGIVQKQKVPR